MNPKAVQALEGRMLKARVKGGRRCKNTAKRKGGGGRKAMFAKDEQELFETIKRKRGDGIKVRAKFVRAQFKHLHKTNYPVGHPLHAKASKFKASSGWLRRFMDRHELTWRKRNNKRTFVVDKYIPGIRSYLNNLRRLRAQFKAADDTAARLLCAHERSGEAGESDERLEQERWGLLGPGVTFNVDQVPLPFAVDDGITMDFFGAKRVWV